MRFGEERGPALTSGIRVFMKETLRAPAPLLPCGATAIQTLEAALPGHGVCHLLDFSLQNGDSTFLLLISHQPEASCYSSPKGSTDPTGD